jgi:hypothetical protein
MKNFKSLLLASAIVVLLATSAVAQLLRQTGMGETETRTILVIKPDSSCVLSNQMTQSRRSMEMQVKAWERFSKLSDGADDEDIAPSAPFSQKDQKPFSDEELVSKIREMYQQRSETEDEQAINLASVEALTDSVRLVTSHSFTSLKELLSQSPYTWGPNVLMFEDASAEIDTNHNFRITFSANPATSRYVRNASREWKSSKMKFEWKLVLPGRILTSGLPSTQDTATWLSIDSDKPDSVDAASKLVGTNLVITAESGGIKLDGPLKSKDLVRSGRRQTGSEVDLPVTDAGPGFLAEAVSISLSTVHYFQEGESYFKNRPEASMFGLNQTGMVITAKLFPPKGREIKSVTDVRVKTAKDDQGRPIAGMAEETDDNASYRAFSGDDFNDSEQRGATRIELRTGLPAPDAKAIEELQGQAVALSIGGWNEMVLTNVQADAKKEIDLGEILPRAKLIIKKIAGKKPQTIIEATLEGPKEVSQIEVKIKLLSNSRGGQSNMNARSTRSSGDKTTRNITVQAYESDMAGESTPPTLLVRYPKDVKRERVEFKLTALDLL